MKKNDKKAVAILVNDVHLNKENGDLIKSIFAQLIQLCRETKVSEIWCGGDVFTNRSGQPLSCLTDWKDILKQIQENNLQLYVTPGNHDKTDQDDERSYLDVYSDRCVHLYRTAGVHVVSSNFVVAFIPYFSDEKWLKEFEKVEDDIRDLQREGDVEGKDLIKILITHSGFDGVVNNDGSAVSSSIKPSMFADWDKVLIGHYHNASKLADNVIYTGSAYQNNYGENITDKGFTIIYDDGTISSVPSKFPKYIKEVVDVDDAESLRNILEKYEGQTDDHIRIIFRGKKVDAKKVNLPELNKLGFDCKYESIEETEAIESSESEAVMCFDKKSIMKDFVKFCTDQNIKGEQLKFGLNLIKNI